jgi:hypothetical protein
MRSRTQHRAAVLLLTLTLIALQDGACALADGRKPGGPSAPGAPGGQSGSIDPLAPFAQGAAALAGMAAPFVNAAGDAFFPNG